MARLIPAIPAVDQSIDKSIRDVLQPLKEIAEIREGIRSSGVAVGNGIGYDGFMRRNVTLGMLVNLGLITREQALTVSQDE